MHRITGFYFIGKKWIVYSTKYAHGRYASMHNREGLTEEQAKGKFFIEHQKEVDYLIRKQKQKN